MPDFDPHAPWLIGCGQPPADTPLPGPEQLGNKAHNLARMAAPDSLNNDLRRLMTRTYTSFKTGL